MNILDGTQRDRVLLELKREGYLIPKMPVDFIDAANLKEAKEKILLISSQYGHMTEESFTEFINIADLDLGELNKMIDLPQIDLGTLRKIDPPIEENETAVHEVVITCKSKREQRGVISSLVKQGYQCRARSV